MTPNRSIARSPPNGRASARWASTSAARAHRRRGRAGAGDDETTAADADGDEPQEAEDVPDPEGGPHDAPRPIASAAFNTPLMVEPAKAHGVSVRAGPRIPGQDITFAGVIPIPLISPPPRNPRAALAVGH